MSQTLGHPEVYGISEISVHILDSCVIVRSLSTDYGHPIRVFFKYISSDQLGRSDKYLGTIHLRHWHALGGEGSKICQICRRTVVKNCRWYGVGVKNCEKFPDVLNGWSLRYFIPLNSVFYLKMLSQS